jgi:hypothetical protein
MLGVGEDKVKKSCEEGAVGYFEASEGGDE